MIHRSKNLQIEVFDGGGEMCFVSFRIHPEIENKNVKPLWWWWGCIVNNAIPSTFYDYKSQCLWGTYTAIVKLERSAIHPILPLPFSTINKLLYTKISVEAMAKQTKKLKLIALLMLQPWLSTIQFFCCCPFSIISLVRAAKYQIEQTNQQTTNRNCSTITLCIYFPCDYQM